MHKKIKVIIATTLILGAVSGMLPANNFTLGGTTKAYASSHDDDDDDYYYDDDDEDDTAYLEDIKLSEGDIDFYRTTYDYDVNVSKDTDRITITAEPEEDDYSVEVDGNYVDEDDDYERSVKLEKGNNTIKIVVENGDEKETYKLNIYRGETSSVATTDTDKTTTQTSGTVTTGTSTSKTGVQNFKIENATKKFNAWNRIDGKLKYLDGTGQVLKNTWWFDKNTGINYYLDKDGARTTGWFNNNGNWYHFNENGEMQTGWICLNSNWYYLNKSGAMKMGWLEDSDGNWYYLDSNGAMKTGWLENTDGNWYYFDATGKMIKDSTINGYHLNLDGVLAN